MKKGEEPLAACEVCGQGRYGRVGRLDERTWVHRCRTCGLRRVAPLPSWDEPKDDFALIDFDE